MRRALALAVAFDVALNVAALYDRLRPRSEVVACGRDLCKFVPRTTFKIDGAELQRALLRYSRQRGES